MECVTNLIWYFWNLGVSENMVYPKKYTKHIWVNYNISLQ